MRVLWPVVCGSPRVLPLGVLYAIGWSVIHLFLLLRPKYLRALRSNLSQILGEPDDSLRVRRLAKRVAVNHARYWIDFLYWSQRDPREARAAVRTVENLPAVERCLGSGRGCIILTAHLGNWEMGGLLLGDDAARVAVVYVPDRFDVVESYRSLFRQRTGLIEIPLTGDALTALPVLRVLRSGGAVAVQGDRDFNDSGISVSFFGKSTYFPRGPATLALIAKVPILPAFILREEDTAGAGSGGFRVIFADPIEPVGNPRDEDAIRPLVAKTAEVIERVVREHPDQWYCFYPFWDDATRDRGAPRRTTSDQAGLVAPTAAT